MRKIILDAIVLILAWIGLPIPNLGHIGERSAKFKKPS